MKSFFLWVCIIGKTLFFPPIWMGLNLPAAICPHLPSFTSQPSPPLPFKESSSILNTTPPLASNQPNRQVGRHRKRPNTGRGTQNAECLKTTTWQKALHGRFQRKIKHLLSKRSAVSTESTYSLSFFCLLSLSLYSFLPMSLLY